MAFESNFAQANFANEGGGNSNASTPSYSNQMMYNSEELRSMAMYLRNNRDNGFLSEINNILARLNGVWEGPAATAFQEKVLSTARKMQDCKESEYISMASQLDRTAYQLEQTTNDIISGINRF